MIHKAQYFMEQSMIYYKGIFYVIIMQQLVEVKINMETISHC